MRNSAQQEAPCGGAQAPSRSKPHKRVVVLVLAALALSPGCAAVTNPVANGIPVRKVPPELLGESRQDLEQTPKEVLERKKTDRMLIGPEDVLGIWIEGVLARRARHLLSASPIPAARPRPWAIPSPSAPMARSRCRWCRLSRSKA